MLPKMKTKWLNTTKPTGFSSKNYFTNQIKTSIDKDRCFFYFKIINQEVTMPECKTGKICYKTKVDAEFALYRCNRMNELNGNNNRHEKNVYFCQFCQCFHLTHKDKYPTWNQYRKHKKR